MIEAAPKRAPSVTQQKFIKNMEKILSVALLEEETCKATLNLAERGLIGQFMGLWPSPKSVDYWTQRNWNPLIKEGVKSYFVGRGFFVFVFESTEDRSLIFRNGPYFMGPQGLYLNKWSPNFDPSQDVPSVVSVWMRLPHLPLHCWNQKSLENIRNAELAYEQLPFKRRHCHGHGHFAKHCKKRAEEKPNKRNGDQWTLVQKTTLPKKGSGKGSTTGIPSSSKPTQEGEANTKGSASTQIDPAAPEHENRVQEESTPPSKEGNKAIQVKVTQGSPSNPSYAEVTRKKAIEISGSSEDETYERPFKRVGRKS
eukprot:PITA_28881